MYGDCWHFNGFKITKKDCHPSSQISSNTFISDTKKGYDKIKNNFKNKELGGEENDEHSRENECQETIVSKGHAIQIPLQFLFQFHQAT